MQLIKIKYYRFGQLSLFMFCLMVVSNTWALSLIINEPQINNILALTFPYQTQMGSSHISLTDPKPHFYEASQEIGITLNITLKDQAGGQTAKAVTTLRGRIRFDNQEQLLQLVKPKIARLDWSDKSAAVNKDLIKQVTKLVGQELPIIVLFDIKQLTGNKITPVLNDIKIKKGGIEVSF